MFRIHILGLGLLLAMSLLLASSAAPVSPDVDSSYRVLVSGYLGADLVFETELALGSGLRGHSSSGRIRAQSETARIVELAALVAASAFGDGPPIEIPGGDGWDEIAPALPYCERLSVGELELYLYLPDCQRYEITVYRSEFSAGYDARAAYMGDGLAPGLAGPEYEYAKLAGLINTPDAEIVFEEPLEQ